MASQYRLIQWNDQKKKYDLIVFALICTLSGASVTASLFLHPEITQETLIIRTSALVALVLLHVILTIGPLSRIFPVFLVLLYNRRHLGVMMFFVAAVHGIFSLLQFHSLGNVPVLVSLFTSNMHYGSFSFFPFQVLGFLALLIFALMALTSHDFWLARLTPLRWKTLHRMVYIAYAMLLFHVFLGSLQGESSSFMPTVLVLGALWVVGVHGVAFMKNKKRLTAHSDGFIEASVLEKVPINRAITIQIGSQKIAVYKTDQGVFAVENRCKHQGGPLGEGKVVDGCITCPWHGYQYLPNGNSPPPFEEKIAIFQVTQHVDGISIDPNPVYEG